MFRYGLRALLESVPDFEVVGEAANGTTAVALVSSLQPDVVVMDLNMPGLTGIDVTRRIVENNPEIRVLVLTMLEDDDSVFAAMRAGARGYVLKSAAPDDILRAIRVVGESEAIFGPAIAARLLTLIATTVPPPQPEAFPELTERECGILWLIAQGATNDQIARRLVLSPKTVRNHVSNIYRKLKVNNRQQAVAKVKEVNLRDRNRDENGTTKA